VCDSGGGVVGGLSTRLRRGEWRGRHGGGSLSLERVELPVEQGGELGEQKSVGEA